MRPQRGYDTTVAALLRELALVAAAALAYVGVRAATEGSHATAIENGRRILDLERSLGIAWEDAAQAALLGSDALVTLANWIYIFGHWPVIVITGAVLFVGHRGSYLLLRRAMMVSGAIGFLFFAFFPVAPPRLLPAVGLVDTVVERSESYRALQPPALTNQYAAMPSLHFGWNLLVGIVLFLTFTTLAVRVFAVLMPTAMGFAVVATANHYVLDAAVGAALVLLGLAVAARVGAVRLEADDRPALRHRPPGGERPRRAGTRGAPRASVGRG